MLKRVLKRINQVFLHTLAYQYFFFGLGLLFVFVLSLLSFSKLSFYFTPILSSNKLRVALIIFLIVAVGCIVIASKVKRLSAKIIIPLLLATGVISSIFAFILTPQLPFATEVDMGPGIFTRREERTTIEVAFAPWAAKKYIAFSTRMHLCDVLDTLTQDRTTVMASSLQDTEVASVANDAWRKPHVIETQPLPALSKEQVDFFSAQAPLQVQHIYDDDTSYNTWILLNEDWQNSDTIYILPYENDVWYIPEQALDSSFFEEEASLAWSNPNASLFVNRFFVHENTFLSQYVTDEFFLYSSIFLSFLFFLISGWLLLLPFHSVIQSSLHALFSPLVGSLFFVVLTILFTLLQLPYTIASFLGAAFFLLVLWSFLFLRKKTSISIRTLFKKQWYVHFFTCLLTVVFTVFPFYTMHGDTERSIRMGTLLAQEGFVDPFLRSEFLGHGWFNISTTALNVLLGGSFNLSIIPVLSIVFCASFFLFIYYCFSLTHTKKASILFSLAFSLLLVCNTVYIWSSILILNNLYVGIMTALLLMLLYCLSNEKISTGFSYILLSFMLFGVFSLRVESALFGVVFIVCALYSNQFKTQFLKRSSIFALLLLLLLQFFSFLFLYGHQNDGRFWSVERSLPIIFLLSALVLFLCFENRRPLCFIRDFTDYWMGAVLVLASILNTFYLLQRATDDFLVRIHAFFLSPYGLVWLAIFILALGFLLYKKYDSRFFFSYLLSSIMLLFLLFLQRGGYIGVIGSDSSYRMLLHFYPVLLLLAATSISNGEKSTPKAHTE